MARPTDYSAEVVEKARAYLTGYSALGEAVPTIAGLASALSVSRKTVYNWIADPEKDAFLHIVDDILQAQETSLVSKGLTGDFNPTITKLLLSKHGYADKQEVSGPDGGPVETSLTVKFVDSDTE